MRREFAVLVAPDLLLLTRRMEIATLWRRASCRPSTRFANTPTSTVASSTARISVSLFERAADYVDRILKGAKPADAGTARYRIRADRCLASRAIVARLREPFGRPAPFRKPPCCAVILITRYFLDFFTGLKIGVRDKSQSILEIGRDELRDLSTTPWRSRRVPKDLEQVGDRREIGIRLSGRRERFALPRLASDRCSAARAFRATGALSKT